MSRPRLSSRTILVVAMLVAQAALVWAVIGSGERGDRLVEQRRMDSLNDCVRERREARRLELETVGLQVLTMPAGPERDRLTAVLATPPPKGDEVFLADFGFCEAALDHPDG